jgi:hypothetical protein
MRYPLIGLLVLTVGSFGLAPVALASSGNGDRQMVILKIKHVGEENKPIPVLFLARDLPAANLVKNAVLEHRVYSLGPEQFEAVQLFWAGEARDRECGPLLCGDVLAHGSFEIAARSGDGALGFDYILPPGSSQENLRKFEKFLEERKIDSALTTNLKAVLASL